MTDDLHSRGESPTNIGGSDRRSVAQEEPITGGEGVTAEAGLMRGATPTGIQVPLSTATPFAPGHVVAGRFNILRTIGRGGMAIVYEAEDRLTNERVALKAILPAILHEPGARRRFSREVNTARRLRHKGLVKVFDLMMSDGVLLFTMEYLHGQTLRDYMAQRDRLDFPAAFHIMDSIAESLEYCHKIAIHRDISPENIMVLHDESVKLLDFGIAKPLEAQQTTQMGGKAYYAAPEQRKPGAQPDVKADIWSLGVCLFEILAGELPMGFQRITRYRPELPQELDDLIGRTVCAHEQRYASVTEFRRALQQCKAAYEKGVSEKTSPQRGITKSGGLSGLLERRGPSGVLAAGIGAAIALAIVAAGGFLLMAKRPEASQAQVASTPDSASEASAVSQEPWDFSGYWSGGAITQMRLEEQGRGVAGWVMSNDDWNQGRQIKGGRVTVLPDGRTQAVLRVEWQYHDEGVEMTATFDQVNLTCDLRVEDVTHALHYDWPLGKETKFEAEKLPYEVVSESTQAAVTTMGYGNEQRFGVHVSSAVPGDGATFSLMAPTEGPYVIGVMFGLGRLSGNSGAICQAYLDGEMFGPPISTACNDTVFSGTHWLAEKSLSAGAHSLTLVLADPESSFESGSRVKELAVFIDKIILMELERPPGTS